MAKNQHTDDNSQRSANQNNQISDDPRDGRRLTNKPEAAAPTPANKAPEQDRQDKEAVDAFGERGSDRE